MAFASLADMRKSRGNFSNLTKEVEKLAAGNQNRGDDERFWSPTVDKVGNGQATIRFLPPAPGEEFPWTRVFSHGFKNPANNKWYIEECPSTINLECPLCQKNSVLWDTGVKENQDIVRERKRHLHYIANILVIKDPAHPENEGKVKLFKFGKKIFDKINEAMNPKFDDETPINPFDFWEGANFKIKICKVEGFRNYDRSEFETPSALYEDDSQIEATWKQQFPLVEFTSAERFKTFDALQTRLNQVLGNAAPIPTAQQQAMDEMQQYAEPAAAPVPPRRPAPAAAAQAPAPSVPPRKSDRSHVVL